MREIFAVAGLASIASLLMEPELAQYNPRKTKARYKAKQQKGPNDNRAKVKAARKQRRKGKT